MQALLPIIRSTIFSESGVFNNYSSMGKQISTASTNAQGEPEGFKVRQRSATDQRYFIILQPFN